MGITDGLGGEEMGQAGSQVSSVHVTGSVYSDSAVQGATVVGTTSVSGANVYSTGTVTGSEIRNKDGLLSMVNGGVVACGAGSGGTIEFATNFKNTTWSIGFATSGAAASACLPTVDGALNVSGATIIGDASTSYYYVAVGY